MFESLGTRATRDKWHNVWGNAEYPLSFAIPELMSVLDVVARCGAAVRTLSHNSQASPPDLWAAMSSTPLQHLAEYSREANRVSSAWQAQHEALQTQQQAIHDAHARLQTTIAREQTAWAEAKRLEGEWKVLADRMKQTPVTVSGHGVADATETINRLYAEAKALAENRDSWQTEATRLANEWQSARKLIDTLRADVHRLYAELQDAVRSRGGAEDHANVLNERVEQGSTREQSLSDQVNLARQEAGEAKQRLTESQHTIDALRAELQASRDQTHSLVLAKRRLENDVQALQAKTPFRVLRTLGVLSEITLEAKPIGVLNRSHQPVDSANDRSDDQRGAGHHAQETGNASGVSHNGDRSSQ